MDIQYLLDECEEEYYIMHVDQAKRDKVVWKTPQHYRVDFVSPFKNVFTIQVMDANIPKTEPNITKYNNTIRIKNVDFISGEWKEATIVLDPKDYTIESIVKELTLQLENIGFEVTVELDLIDPYKLLFTSRTEIKVDMQASTMRDVLGFGDPMNKNHFYFNKTHTSEPNYRDGDPDVFVAVKQSIDDMYRLSSPGKVNLLGSSYVILRCPEIEENFHKFRASEIHFMSLAKFNMTSFGFNQSQQQDGNTRPKHRFFPIASLTRLTLFFETPDGRLYDFTGINHSLIIMLGYYAPKRKSFLKSVANPHYAPHKAEYLQLNNYRQ